jgi:hypothetical protein
MRCSRIGFVTLFLALVVGCGGESLYHSGGSGSGGGMQTGTGTASDAATGVGGAAASGASSGGNAVAASSSGSETSGVGGSPPGPMTDFSQAGPFTVAMSTGTMAMPGCGFSNQMTHDLYVPMGGETAPLVALGHGFQRNKDKMVEMANHMASHGVRVVAPNFCHSSIGDTNHEQNAADLVTLVASLAGGAGVIYAGYSAGGTAAILAAKSDASTIALLGLDAVDSDGLAVAAVPHVAVPALGFVGESSSCNSSNNNGTFLVSLAPQGSSVRVHGATHCDFEGPTDFLCTGFCGGTMAGTQQLIKHLATAFVAWRSGVDSSGAQWVKSGGQKYEQLVKGGQLSAL